MFTPFKNILPVCLIILFCWSPTCIALSFNIKAYNIVPDHNEANFNSDYASTLRDDLIDPANFGGSGAVRPDISFTILDPDVPVITEDVFTGTDIFIVCAGNYSGDYPSRGITAAQGQMFKNFVDNGGSLIIMADYTAAARTSANNISVLFGLNYGADDYAADLSWSFAQDGSPLPAILQGPFGSVSSVGTHNHGVAVITDHDPAITKMLDLENNYIAVKEPSATSGSVIFLSDVYSFLSNGSDVYGSGPGGGIWGAGDLNAFNMNMFAYSADSVYNETVIPEPASVLLLLFSLLSILVRKK